MRGEQFNTTGIHVFKVPLGSFEFQIQYANERVDAVERLMQCLDRFKKKQAAFKLLRYSLNYSRLLHILRGTPQRILCRRAGDSMIYKKSRLRAIVGHSISDSIVDE